MGIILEHSNKKTLISFREIENELFFGFFTYSYALFFL